MLKKSVYPQESAREMTSVMKVSFNGMTRCEVSTFDMVLHIQPTNHFGNAAAQVRWELFFVSMSLKVLLDHPPCISVVSSFILGSLI